MAMTLRLSEKEQRALKKRAERDGVSMQDAARRAIREYHYACHRCGQADHEGSRRSH
ncbi:MAG: ribbon-helix-helix protein, CopG family [Acidimicrobiia bacterium]|nr:ribbon-helix-helix protein, CopG family [Acidimicrobiia bacterium]